MMEKRLSSFFSYLGPAFLALALFFTHQIKDSYDLYFIVPISLVVISISPKKGFFFSLFLLLLSSFFIHFFFAPNLFFRIGIDVIISSSLFLIWQVEEERSHFVDQLHLQLSAKEKFLQGLEEEIGQQKEEELSLKISLSSKIEDLQKKIEEVEVEKGTIEILNDVLRKNQAEAFLQEEALCKELILTRATLDELIRLYQMVEEEKEMVLEQSESLASVAEKLSFQLFDQEEENQEKELLISKLVKEPTSSHLSENLREAFSPKNRPTSFKGASLEETLRESLLAKKKKR